MKAKLIGVILAALPVAAFPQAKIATLICWPDGTCRTFTVRVPSWDKCIEVLANTRVEADAGSSSSISQATQTNTSSSGVAVPAQAVRPVVITTCTTNLNGGFGQ